MKKFSTIFLFAFLAVECCFSQDSPVSVYLTELPNKGVLLDKGWKFQTGDNSDYSKPGYDDSNWQAVNPALNVHELPQIKQSIVWFRLHLSLDNNLLNEQLALAVEQSGASEIYLNGSLIHRFGVFNTDPAKVRAYDPLGFPIGFPAEKNAQQILAVRYALQPGVRYTTIFGSHNFALKARLNTVEAAAQIYRDTSHLESLGLFIIGILVMLLVLHLSFYLFYRSQKANLFFSLFALLTIISTTINFNISHGGHWVENEFFLFNLAADIIFIGFLSMVTAIYYLLEQKRGMWYTMLMILFFLGMILYALPDYRGWEYGSTAINILLNLEITRIAFIAVKKKRKGAWIIAIGCAMCLACWATFIAAGQAGEDDMFTIVVFALAWLSIPVSASIYLGVSYAFTNRVLQQKLAEVSELSQKTIAQEKEKQQILSSVNDTLEKQVAERTIELKQSFEELKATQNQLIQAEKMASLGELTAGIAHEIQNPLNFVNNFSEVNNELIEELKSENQNLKSEERAMILKDIYHNNEKIKYHGKKADAIVKNMIQHSRTTDGKKELTDLNALCDEYLRLAYLGMRAKDKSFDAKFETSFDNSFGKVNIIPQEIGRVMLNLINNAFYAVNETQKESLHGYEPKVAISTSKQNGKVELRVKDNGTGIPKKILDKIFQPFFTTKPTGQGTGLGLSLAYDIMIAHGGEIKVESIEGEGSEFIISLPAV